jgi:hypothetical protein
MNERNRLRRVKVLDIKITATPCHKRHEVCHNMAVTCTSKSAEMSNSICVLFGSYILLWSHTVSPNTAMYLLKFLPIAALMSVTFHDFFRSLQIIAFSRQFSSTSLAVHGLRKQTNSVSQRSCWEAERFSCSRNCLSFMVHYHVHRGPTLCSVLNYMKQATLSCTTSLRSILILLSHVLPCLSTYLFLSWFSDKNFGYISHAHLHVRRPSHLISIDFTPIKMCIFCEQYKLWCTSLCNFLNDPLTPLL